MKFYDTCSLLLLDEEQIEEKFVISSITLKELEEIKTSNRKTEDIKYKVRKLTNWLSNNRAKYDVIIYTMQMLEPITEKQLPINNDTEILSCAIWYDKNVMPDEVTFVTNDLSLFSIANLFFGEDSVESIDVE